MEHLEPRQRVIYSPESQLRTPYQLFKAMIHDLFSSRELAWRLFVRDISAQYRQSLFGILWAFLPPLITGLIFIVLQTRNIIDLGETEIPYPVFAITGTILWQIFVESLNAPLKSVILAKPIIAKINFPYEALPLSAIYNVIFSFFVKVTILIALFFIYRIDLTPGILLAPIGIIILILFGVSLGLFITPLGILYSDVSSSLPVITQLWFFITPVVYAVPNLYPYNLLATINPVSPLLIGIRELLTTGAITNPIPFLSISAISFVLMIVAWILFRISIPILVERISA